MEQKAACWLKPQTPLSVWRWLFMKLSSSFTISENLAVSTSFRQFSYQTPFLLPRFLSSLRPQRLQQHTGCS